MSTSDLFAGVDVSADRVHAALVRGDTVTSLFSGPPLEIPRFCRSARRVAVDAPGGLSLGAHSDDPSVAPKFRSGRCSEVPVAGVPAVPWVTPPSLEEAPGWMRTGFAVWQVLEAAGLEVVETFPAACFHRLNGGRWPPRKTTPAGRADRLCLLAAFIDLPPDAGMWGHDAIDAVVCALVAQRGRPAGHECDRPDGSVIWLLDDVVGARTEDRQAVQDR